MNARFRCALPLASGESIPPERSSFASRTRSGVARTEIAVRLTVISPVAGGAERHDAVSGGQHPARRYHGGNDGRRNTPKHPVQPRMCEVRILNPALTMVAATDVLPLDPRFSHRAHDAPSAWACVHG